MKNYELTYLITPEITEEEIKELQGKMKSLIETEGGILIEENLANKKVLSSPIKKRSSGYLATLNFQLNSEKLTNLEKKLRSEDKILRYLILTKKKTLPLPTKPRRIITKPKSKVELKDIEKKLEEILS